MEKTKFVKSFASLLGPMVTMAVILSGSAEAWASSIYGKVTFLGTLSEAYDNGYHAQFRFRLSNSTCDSNTTPGDRWVHVRSGRMDGAFAHNSANLRNAYDTLLNAFLTSKNVQVDGVPNCTTTGVQTLDLWKGNIGMY